MRTPDIPGKFNDRGCGVIGTDVYFYCQNNKLEIGEIGLIETTCDITYLENCAS